jgi:hypothetical protein
LVFLGGMVTAMTIGEPLALGGGLTWRNVVAMCAIPWLCGYAGYHMGWINGHYAGWIKARDEYRPNAHPHGRAPARTVQGVVGSSGSEGQV